MKICESCKKEHSGEYASGRFCSRFCSASFSTSSLNSEEKLKLKIKISLALTKHPPLIHINCPICQKTFLPKTRVILHCSRSCGAKQSYRSKSDEQKIEHGKRSKKRMQDRYAAGDLSIGWQSRSKSSYPEIFFENLLRKDDINFKREVKIGKWFADFLINNIVLEIDGRQHDDRKNKDEEKDLYLNSKGFKVIRIKWRNPRSPSGLTELMKNYEDFKFISANLAPDGGFEPPTTGSKPVEFPVTPIGCIIKVPHRTS